MPRLFLLPTGTPARPGGGNFMLWGDATHVWGITDRLLFSRGALRLRLTVNCNGSFAGVLRSDENGARWRLQHDVRRRQRVSRSTPYFHWHLEPEAFTWSFFVSEHFMGDCWPQEPVHAGYVPCAVCMHPRGFDGERMDSCVDGLQLDVHPARIMRWADLVPHFDFACGTFAPSIAGALQHWRGVLGISRPR